MGGFTIYADKETHKRLKVLTANSDNRYMGDTLKVLLDFYEQHKDLQESKQKQS